MYWEQIMKLITGSQDELFSKIMGKLEKDKKRKLKLGDENKTINPRASIAQNDSMAYIFYPL